MSLAHALLAAIIEQPCSGYDLAKQFDGTVGFFWKASHQQIYRELSKLEADGWVTAETIRQAGRPDKKLFSPTELGQQHLLEWIAQPSEPGPPKEELLVKIFVGYLAPCQVIVEELERHRQAHQEKLSVFQAVEQRYFQNPQELPLEAKFRYLTLCRGIGYETSWLTWCEQALQILSV